MRMKFFIFLFLLVLLPVQADCDDSLKIKLEVIITQAYLTGYNTGSCEEIGLISRLTAREVWIENPDLRPEEISLIKDVIEILDNCCLLGTLERQYGEYSLPELLKKIEQLK